MQRVLPVAHMERWKLGIVIAATRTQRVGLSSVHGTTALGGFQTGLCILFPTKSIWVSEQGTKRGTCQCQHPSG